MKPKSIYLVIIVFLFCCAEDPEPGDPTYPGYPGYQVRYKVEGSAAIASISIMDENNQSKIFSNETLPWEYIFPKKVPRHTYLYVSAQHNQSQGVIVVVIYNNETVFKSDTSSGEFATATAAGRL